jgi:hypothetical protein
MKVKTQIQASVGPVGAHHNEALRRAWDSTVSAPTLVVGPSTTSHPSFTAWTPPILVSPSTTWAPQSPGAPRTPCLPNGKDSPVLRAPQSPGPRALLVPLPARTPPCCL